MKKVLLFCLIVAFGASCNDDDGGGTMNTLNLQYRLTYDGAPLIINQKYDYQDYKLFFSKVSFFVSDVELGQNAYNDINNIDFTEVNTSMEAADEGIRVGYNLSDLTTIDEVKLGLGVNPTLNATAPGDYPIGSSPLANNSEYWGVWMSYIFAKFEGKVDVDGDEIYEKSFTYHTGNDNAFAEASLQGPININPGVNVVTIDIELKDIFTLGGDLLNIDEVGATHNAVDTAFMQTLMESFANSITMNN